jgi:hypothetical protein
VSEKGEAVAFEEHSRDVKKQLKIGLWWWRRQPAVWSP